MHVYRQRICIGNIYNNIYSKLLVSQTNVKSGFSISRTNIVSLVGFVSSSMLN